MKKLKTILYSALPVCLWLAIQVVLSVGFALVLLLIPLIFRNLGWNAQGIMGYLEREYLSILSIGINMIFLIPGYFWYRHLAARSEGGELTEKRACFTKKAWVRVFFLGICLQLTVDILLVAAQIFFPETMASYMEVMESLGVENPSIWSALYVGVLAPITEELIFRGLTLRILEQTFSFPAANVIQALYFALIHGNLVQGLYAFGMGLVIGKLTHRYGTLKAGILCHFAVNISGLVLGGVSMNLFGMGAGAVVLALLTVLLREKSAEE